MILACFFVALSLLHFLFQFITWIGLLAEYKPDRPVENKPFVSILIAARNEEDHILSCLQGIHALTYPKEKLQVLIGDDLSEDHTASIVQSFIQDKAYMQLIPIHKTLGKAQGKANVLAQLAHMANGEYFFITDADIIVNPKWIESILAAFDERTAIVSGATFATGNNLWQRMQAIDWTYFGGMLVGITKAGLPCTAVGNNMAITRKAYFDTGGYELIDFSVTEDYKLFEAVRSKGWQTKNIFTRGSYHLTQTLHSFSAVLHQRKRWLTGGKDLPFYWKIILGVYGLFHPLFLCVLFIQPVTALLLLSIKVLMEFLITNMIRRIISQPPLFLSFLIHQIYSIALNISLSLFYYIPLPFRWKNRKYTK